MAADGSVSLETKLDNSEIPKGVKDAEKQLDKMADAAKNSAKQITKALDNIEVDDVADGMAESFDSESEKIKAILDDTSSDAKTKAAKIAAVYREAGEDQSTAMKKAWDVVKRESQTGSRKVQDDIDDIGDKAKSTGNEIESSLGGAFSNLASKIGGIMATAFAVDEIADFAKESIELGSALSEVQNVVDVTFGESKEIINDFAKGAIKDYGLAELSAKQFASTFGAMLKSMGGSEDEVVDMSQKLTGLAGDLASFYNLDAQDAFDKLRAGISGETEPLKQLGVLMNVANLEAYAMANGIETAYEKMTPWEQTLLRYNFILDALADAQGDFARTQDSWANQTRILTEEFNSLKGTLGQGLINVLNPLVTSINGSLMPVLQGLADKFVELTETFDWNDLIGDVDFGPILSSLGTFSEKCSQLAGVIGSGLKWAWDNVLVPLGGWAIDAGLPAVLDALSAAFGALTEALEWLSPLASAIWNDFLQPIASWVGDAVIWTLGALTDAFNFLADAFANPAIDSVTWFTEAMTRAGQYAQTGMIDPIMTGLGDIDAKSQETSDNLSTDMQNATAAAGAAGVETVESAVTAMDTITAAEQESIAATSEAIVAGNQQLLDSVTTNTAAANATLATDAANTGNQIANSYTDAANSVTATAFTPIEESGTATAESTAESFDDAANTMKTAWGDMGPWFDSNVSTPIKTSIDGVSQSALTMWTDIEAETRAAWARMVQVVNDSINQMQNKINSLTGKTVNVGTSGASYASASAASAYSAEAYTPAAYSVTPQIPYLATGAVIPPMAPFLAVLGDQRNGTNLEAPEDLIRKIVREESGSAIEVETKVTFEGTLAQFVRMLFPVFKSEARRRGNSLAKEVIE